jgi:hypothetical protein
MEWVMLTKFAMTWVSKLMACADRAVADWVPNIFICEAAKSGWSKQKVSDAEFMGTELGFRRAYEAMEASVVVPSIIVVGK